MIVLMLMKRKQLRHSRKITPTIEKKIINDVF